MGFDNRDYYKPRGFGFFSNLSPIIKNLLIANIIVFFVQVIFENINFGGIPGWYLLNRYFALNPIAGVDQVGQSFNFQIWQLFTYQFMHGNFMHILFNMFALWMFGSELAYMWGDRKFFLFYLVCGLGAGIIHLFFSPIFSSQLAPTLGASGSIFGILVAYALYFPNRYIITQFLIPVKAKYLIVFYVVLEFSSVGDMSGFAHLAHIGGAITGAILILLDKKYYFNIDKIFNYFKNITKPKDPKANAGSFRRPVKNPFYKDKKVEEAEFYEINPNEKKESEPIPQEEIDRILDKISKSGYQNLTKEEKKVLFEASKRN